MLNPQRRHYAVLRDHLKATYEDVYWHEDLVCMELNSRHFAHRIDVINRNAEVVADWFWCRSEAYDAAHGGELQSSNSKKRIIKKVFFPKWETRENYDAYRRRPAANGVAPLYPSGFGSFFTLWFNNEAAAKAFYDNLSCEKGPTWGEFFARRLAECRVLTSDSLLGTNFTLACAYVFLTHYVELDWAAEWGVPTNVVRVSVGMEDPETILGWMKHALEAAETASGL